MKKVFFIIIVVFGIILIYSITKDKKIYYLSLGDELSHNSNYDYTDYINNYLKDSEERFIDEYYEENMRVIDLINMIKDNKQIEIDNKKMTIQNSLIKADLVTISIGDNDLLSKLTLYGLYSENEIYEYIDEYLLDLEKLLIVLRKYCKERMIFIGYYNIINDKEVDKYYKYLINKTKRLTKIYNLDYLDIYEAFNGLKYRSSGLYPNKEGYTYIGQEIVKIIDK